MQQSSIESFRQRIKRHFEIQGIFPSTEPWYREERNALLEQEVITETALGSLEDNLNAELLHAQP